MNSMGNRERLLAAATEVFLEHGYGASVDMLVQRAGVARQTFYNHFHNKESLFAEAMRHCVSEMMVPLDAHAGDLRVTLLEFGRAYRQRVLSPQSIAKFRIVTAQAQRFPELTGEEYAHGLGKMLKRVAEILGAAMDEGQLRRDDPEFAAEMLLAMLAGMDRARLLFGVATPPHDEAARVKMIVEGFLRMFAAG